MQKKAITLVLPLIIVAASGQTVQAKTIDVPEEVVEISEELGEQYGICPELVQAICYTESRFQPDAEGDGCVGIMQVAPKWHKERMDRLGVTDLTDMRQNMTVAVDYLSELAADGTDITEALMRYHGESDVDGRLSECEVSDYAEGILELSEELEREHGK